MNEVDDEEYLRIRKRISVEISNEVFKNFDPKSKKYMDLFTDNYIIDPDKIIKNGDIENDPKKFYKRFLKIKQLPKAVYHYCNIDAFMKIIENKSIYLSNTKLLNDLTECRWIEIMINRILQEININNKEYISYFSKFYYKRNTISYIACFSEKKDLLSQWRGYTENASGISIGFDPKYLELNYNAPIPASGDGEYNKGIHYVEYDEEIQLEIIRKIIIDAIKCEKVCIESNIFGNCRFQAVDILSRLAPIYKNSSFKEEKEWRIIYRPWMMSDIDKKESLKIYDDPKMKLKFRARNNEIISYLEYKFEKFDSKLIPEVCLGPKCNVNKDELRYFLNEHGLGNTEISISESTFR